MMRKGHDSRLVLRGSPIDGLVELVIEPQSPRRQLRLEVCRFVGEHHKWSEEIPGNSVSWDEVGPDGLRWPTWRFSLVRLDLGERTRRATRTVGRHRPQELSKSVEDAVSLSWLSPKSNPRRDSPDRKSHHHADCFAADSLGPGPNKSPDARTFVRISALALHNRGWLWTYDGSPWIICPLGEPG